MKPLIRNWLLRSSGLLLGMTLCFILFSGLNARDFRSMRPIATPTKPKAELPANTRAVEKIRPLTVAQVTPAVERVIESWNTYALGKHLSEEFFDATRLLDALDTVAPRDAKLRLQSVQAVQTLQQYIEPDPNRPDREQLVSKVSATARTQLEFQASDGSFVRLPGTNEFLLKITFPEQGN